MHEQNKYECQKCYLRLKSSFIATYNCGRDIEGG